MTTTQIVIYVVIGLYICLMVGVGIYFRNKAKSQSAFWSADGSIGWFVNSFAVLATIMSGGGMLGNIGSTAVNGISFSLMASWSTCLGTGLAAMLVAAPLRKSGAKTLSDFMHIRYSNRGVGTLVGLVISIAYTIYLVAQLKAAGTVSESLLGVNYMAGNIVVWLVFTLYTILGGMLAVTWNDFIQGILMVTVVVICGATAFSVFGGYGDIMTAANKVYPGVGGAGVGDMGAWFMPSQSQIGVFVIWFLVALCAPTVLMRMATAKSPFSAGMSMHAAMFWLSIFVTGTIAILGPATRAFAGANPPDNNDAYLLIFVKGNFGPIVQGLVASAIFAAIMSTAAGLLLAASASFSNDILKRFMKMTPKGESRMSIVSILVISTAALLLSFNPPPLLSILYAQAIAFLLCSLFCPYILGMWWKRATYQGAAAGILTGSAVFCALKFGMTMPLFSEPLYALPISLVVTIVVSLATPKPSVETVRMMESWHDQSDYQVEKKVEIIH